MIYEFLLQFVQLLLFFLLGFVDGKFILELARAKEGDKAGWVSVPRKAFRTPSAATSATVTPTSAVTTTYPKNENSTSLSCKCLQHFVKQSNVFYLNTFVFHGSFG